MTTEVSIQGFFYVKPGEQIALALDIASSEFYSEQGYFFESENKHLTSDELIDRMASWVDQYPIVSIEDGLSEDDWEGWSGRGARVASAVIL